MLTGRRRHWDSPTSAVTTTAASATTASAAASASTSVVTVKSTHAMPECRNSFTVSTGFAL
jgi:hypothetical protein